MPEGTIAVEGEAVVTLNHGPSRTEKQGFSRDWRFTPDWASPSGNPHTSWDFYPLGKGFSLAGTETPVGAFAPKGIRAFYPLTEFTAGGPSPSFASINAGGLYSIVYLEGGFIHPNLMGWLDLNGTCPRDWHFGMLRMVTVGTAKTAVGVLEALINPVCAIRMECECLSADGSTWQKGYLSWVIPGVGIGLNSLSAGSPFLHVMTPQSLWNDGNGTLNFDFHGTQLARSQHAPTMGIDHQAWTCQYLEPESGRPGHFFFTLGGQADVVHYYNDGLRLPRNGGSIKLLFAGAITHFAFGPMDYGRYFTKPHTLQAPAPAKLPDANVESIYNPMASFSLAVTEPIPTAGAPMWSTTVSEVVTPAGYLPSFSMQLLPGHGGTNGPVYQRPIAWTLSERHPATLAIYPVTQETTNDIAKLYKIELTETADYRGSTAVVDFHRCDPAEWTNGKPFWQNWQENDLVRLRGGWQSTITGTGGVQDLCDYYIRPGGLPVHVGNDSVGSPVVRMQLGDFVSTRLRKAILVDFQQAAGRTVGEWFSDCAARMGIPAGEVSIAADVTDLVIPYNEKNVSDPTLAPNDGDTWLQHIDQVVSAMGLRWGCNREIGTTLFVDRGPEAYVDGVSTIALQITKAAKDQGRIYSVDSASFTDDFANAVKLIVGHGGPDSTWYAFDTAEQMAADIGQLWWSVLQTDTLDDAARFVTNWLRINYSEASKVINVRMVANPDVKRGSFIQQVDDFGNGVIPNSIFRVIERRLIIDASRNEGDMELLGVIVHVPT